jgi:hypothetical protein
MGGASSGRERVDSAGAQQGGQACLWMSGVLFSATEMMCLSHGR